MSEPLANDYTTIRARLEEIKRERETAIKGESFGPCSLCQEKKTQCTGACCRDD